MTGPHPADGPPIPPAGVGAPFDLVLLDRDGTLNVQVVDDYVREPGGLRLLPGAAAAVGRLRAAGCRVVVVTNQRGVSRGLMTLADLDAVHGRLEEGLAAQGAALDAVLSCVHAAGECGCRKPAPGLLDEAFRRAPWAARERSVLVGDSGSDLAAARAAGVPARRVGPAGAVPSLLDVVTDLLGGRDG